MGPSNKSTKKTAAKSAKKPAAKSKALDLDKELSVENLLARGAKLEEERETRAKKAKTQPQTVRAPVPSRSANPVEWQYPWCFDDAIPGAERSELVSFFEKFTKVGEDRSAFFVVAPDTVPERRRAAWDAGGTVLELDQLRAQLPADDAASRTARLERVLAAPNGERWDEAIMLLSTWEASSLPDAIAVASRALEKWPDAMRSAPDCWKDRPELLALSRLSWGTIADALARPDLENVRVLKTQDIDGLKEHRDRFTHITSLDLSGKTGLGDDILALPELANLEQLELQQPTYDQGTGKLELARLLAAPHLRNLKALSLYGFTLTAKDLDALAECEQPLERLRIQYAGMKPALAASLATLASRKKLVSLDVKYNDLGPKGAEALFANASDWTSLRVLDFSANEIGDRGAAAIAAASMTSLHWLNLSSNDPKEQLSAAGAKSLAGSASLGALRTLNVYGHPVGAEGIAALVESPALRSMTGLSTAFPGTDLASLMAACGNGSPVPLTEIHLGNPDASKKKTDWSRASFLANVKTLNLDSLDGAEYAGVFSCPHLGALEILSFGGCYSNTEDAFAALLAATPPPNLHYLNLSGWKMTPDQATAFCNSPLGRQLWGLQMMASYTPPETWRAFYDGGLPLVGYSTFTCDPASENSTATTFREEFG